MNATFFWNTHERRLWCIANQFYTYIELMSRYTVRI